MSAPEAGVEELVYTINAQGRCLEQIRHLCKQTPRSISVGGYVLTDATMAQIEQLSRKLKPEQYRCVHCLAIVAVGAGDECPECLADGPPCVQCNKRGHFFREEVWAGSVGIGFWDEDCNYHDRYANDPRI